MHKTMTFVARHLYFGLDPLHLRDAANRVLQRVSEDTSVSAAVRLDALVEDLHLSPTASKAIIEEMVQSGVLTSVGSQYGITPRFREIARARIIEPLERSQAQLLVAHCAEVAEKFNRSAHRNKYEIRAVAVYGHYMTRHKSMAELELGITGRHRREENQKNVIGRASQPTEGTSEIRELFEKQSGFIMVTFYKRLELVPRPFGVIFKAD